MNLSNLGIAMVVIGLISFISIFIGIVNFVGKNKDAAFLISIIISELILCIGAMLIK